jgi:isocitrate dehydrogenase (NAD+)
MKTTITLLRGDGIGPEVVDAAVRVIDATGAEIEWETRDAGTGAIAKHGAPLPEETLDSIRRTRLCLKGPLATPIGGGYSSINVALRREFELFANVRPARTFAGLRGRYDQVDLVVVRENTQGEYSGIEHYIDPTRSAAEAISIITRHGCDRIVRFAFEYARANRRQRVTLVHKANILKMTSGLFLQVGREIAQSYPDIGFSDLIVDNTAMQLVRDPTRFDVIVTTNLFGDILSDLTAGLVGGLGLVPGANIGEDAAIFEAVHGTAPDIAGRGLANPTAVMLAGAMMLERMGQRDRGQRLEKAVRAAIAAGRELTPDLGGTGTTASFTARVLAALENPEAQA